MKLRGKSESQRGLGLQGYRAIKRRAPGLQNENVRALGLHIICLCFRAPGSTAVYNSDMNCALQGKKETLAVSRSMTEFWEARHHSTTKNPLSTWCRLLDQPRSQGFSLLCHGWRHLQRKEKPWERGWLLNKKIILKLRLIFNRVAYLNSNVVL